MRTTRLGRWGAAAIALGVLLLLTVLTAPASHRLNSGSTWGRGPDGYGAWYDYLQAQSVTVQRWQRPLSALVEQVDAAEPAALLQIWPRVVSPEEFWRQPGVQQWLGTGHSLVVLGLSAPVTAAPFTAEIETPLGAVTVQTRRRASDAEAKALLQDDYGPVVWQPPQNKGQLILAATPFLGANAYLHAPGNFAFLADLLPEGVPLYIDEYLHGYRAPDPITEEEAGSWLDYLAQTPLRVMVIQLLVVTGVGLLAHNRRPGVKQTVSPPSIDDSAAYMQALAGVLHKANSRDFLVETLVGSERQALQQALGLGRQSVSDHQLRTAWHRKTGQPQAELDLLFGPGQSDLHAWLLRLQTLHVIASQRTDP